MSVELLGVRIFSCMQREITHYGANDIINCVWYEFIARKVIFNEWLPMEIKHDVGVLHRYEYKYDSTKKCRNIIHSICREVNI